ncbi:3-keto-steroid reductase-like protein [Hapsidospora chrysogenum ATCC 11550]|uniref:3-keto-steroid reductase-like protein n=1 Tax=Hapsidospora chrysogenum (strain ATCC 11550 / CBS 779.69 / DSM 880 / IAM 14645 / JCM 23072 / IMI 49137) TaxID=857340 RepID=A0A086STL1_HAPC1|nr:3-keto-steroid reductase-like protein [Hapsidospora chrysogenum ATCC 11550]
MAVDKKIILITGANSGIGYRASFAIANASPSNHVVMTARSAAKGTAALAELQARNPAGTLSFLELDVTSDASIAAAAERVEADFGKLDVLINNAGVTESIRLADKERARLTRDEFLRVFDTNVFGSYLLTQALEPLLRKASSSGGGGAGGRRPIILNVSSGLGSVDMRTKHDHMWTQFLFDCYRMSKSALNMMTVGFQWHFREWANVFAFDPGFTMSNLTGPEDVETRRAMGADSGEMATAGILDILDGKRDKDIKLLVSNDENKVYAW